MKKPALPSIPAPLTADEMTAVLSPKDRGNFDRQIANMQLKSAPGTDEQWRRLTAVLMAMASKLVKITGLQTVQFYIPDGKHRKQVFALSLNEKFEIIVYVPNVLEQAIAAHLLTAVRAADPGHYKIGAGPDQVFLQPLDGSSISPQPAYKEMTGWNRKALAITLPAGSTEVHLHLAEQLAAIGAAAWATATPTAS